MQYIPLVEVHGAEGYIYWNPLTKEVCATYAEAQRVVEEYKASRQASGRTKISAR